MEMSQSTFKKIIEKSFVLLAGSVGSSILGLLVISIVTKHTSLFDYGLIVMIQAYVLFVDQIFNFQSWQALIKYGVVALNEGDKKSFLELLRLSVFLDIIGSLIAFGCSLLLLKPLALVFNFDIDNLSPLLFYSSLILFRWIGTPTALLRMNDRYSQFNYQQFISWGGKLIGVLFLVLTNAIGVKNILCVFLVSEALSLVYLIVSAIRLLKKYNLKFFDILPRREMLIISQRGRRFLTFALRSNLNGAILGGVRTLDELIIGSMIGPSSAALFKVMKMISNIVSKLLDPFYTVIYPELSQLVAKNNRFEISSLIRKSTLINFSIGLMAFIAFYFSGEKFISVFFTADYLVSLPMMRVYLIGVIVTFVFFYIQPLMLAFELEGKALLVNLMASVVYLVMLIELIPVYDIWSVVFSHIAFIALVTIPKIFILQVEQKVFINTKKGSSDVSTGL